MSVKIIQERLDSYNSQSIQEERFALKEITQELALHSLYNAGFFKRAAFQGGTCLRILYGLNRFSEDLDFALIEPDRKFDLSQYLASMSEELKAFGYDVKIETKASADNTVRNAFLKDDSLGRIINVPYPQSDRNPSTIKIKFELDTNPPAGARIETKFHDFPVYFSVTVHDLSSLFAGKSHALLVRPYIKGRDWFDFLWYISRKATINFELLSNALEQLGPWKGKKIKASMSWYKKEMTKRIKSIDWEKAKADVARFLRPADLKTLELWNTGFFLTNLNRLISHDLKK
ncbi:nucleotidyl transferase AbiEii/AbiGii toxin family protein [bacterium]|nr:nucleotidyl transferase AbiEii/AbiGii toxin family protein [bacterium]